MKHYEKPISNNEYLEKKLAIEYFEAIKEDTAKKKIYSKIMLVAGLLFFTTYMLLHFDVIKVSIETKFILKVICIILFCIVSLGCSIHKFIKSCEFEKKVQEIYSNTKVYEDDPFKNFDK